MRYDTELIRITRNGHLDCVHRGRVAVVDASGQVIFAAGDPHAPAYLRSVAKPFQAQALYETGAASRFQLSEREIAIIAGSHSGTPAHTGIVAHLLAKIGLEPAALQCGMTPPLSPIAYRELLLSGHTPTTLHHNCSGKHSGMLACCLTQSWDIAHYPHADHPLQILNRRLIAEAAGLPVDRVDVALDGCSVPTFGMPLVNIAQMMAHFGSTIKDTAASPLGEIGQAMLAYPLVYSGENRIDADLVQAAKGGLLAKDGAEGLIAVTIPERGLGIALKVSDGNQRAIMPTLIHLLKSLDVLSPDAEAELTAKYPPWLVNVAGQPSAQIDVMLDV